MKSTFQVTAPQRYNHLDVKKKKYQIQEEIERENRLLLEKMTTIMTTKPQQQISTSRSIVMRQLNNRNGLNTSAGGGGLWHNNHSHNRSKSSNHQHSRSRQRNNHNNSMNSSQQHSSSRSSVRSKNSNNSQQSLNYLKRKRDSDRIQNENVNILRRLREKKSNYNVVSWERENVNRQKYLFNIAEYPRPLELPTIKVCLETQSKQLQFFMTQYQFIERQRQERVCEIKNNKQKVELIKLKHRYQYLSQRKIVAKIKIERSKRQLKIKFRPSS
eukprot:403361606